MRQQHAMYCPKCGTECTPGHTRCSDCGVGLVNRRPPTRTAQTDDTSKRSAADRAAGIISLGVALLAPAKLASPHLDQRLLGGWMINAVWLPHLFFWNRSPLPGKIAGLFLLAIPGLGFLLYFILLVWDIPPPQPKHMRQNRMNHYGTSEYGNDDDDPEFSMESTLSIRKLVEQKPWIRCGVFMVGSTITLLGLSAILGLGGSYRNWWGGRVFGPPAVLIGIGCIYVMTMPSRKRK